MIGSGINLGAHNHKQKFEVHLRPKLQF